MTGKRVLFVFAHPDDETFTSGIAISKYARETDTQLHLVCATRGQAGKAGDPPVCSREELPQVRERELREACRILGMTSVEVWDYQDKALNQTPPGELVTKIQDAFARYRPQVVVTFAPHGISGHPDHQAISAAVTQAVQNLPEDSTVCKLYYATRARETVSPSSKPVFTDSYDTITTIIKGPAYCAQVASALQAHRTQHLSVERVFPGVCSGDFRHVPSQNTYILAWHRLSGYVVAEKEDDFFAGISPFPKQ